MEVKPFKAFRFNEKVVGNVGSCIAPPYDVIGPAQQQLYQKSKYNIVRIIKGKTIDSDNASNNQYTRAADYLNTWIEKGALKQDPVEAIYAYAQDFQLAGTQFQRLSFIALAKLKEFGKTVRPHEQTLNAPIIDRLNLQRATAAKFGLPFCLYEDEQKIADKIIERTTTQKTLVDFLDEQNVRHRLFVIDTKDDIDAIVKMMHDKSCIMADGHHRYETGLAYSKESDNPAAKYQMIALANTHHEGLIVLATHRLVDNLKSFCFEKFIADLKGNFEITEFQFDSPRDKTDTKQKALAKMRAEQQIDKNAFVIYSGHNAFYLTALKDKQAMDSASEKSSSWRSLDVSVLHKLVLEKLLGIDEKQLASQSNVEYIKDTDNAIDESIDKVDAGQKQVAFFMNPPKMEQIQMIADQGEKMPQKSTYFYPKIYTGLTINKL
jgi:uncharacterized protein (DUF1015 family)